jgi:hypothetical protein
MDRDPEKYARESFSFRRMKGWQLWGITAAAVVVVVVVLSYGIA